MLSATTASSVMPSKCLTRARREFPCAATRVTRPFSRIRHDAVVPVRQRPDHDILQAFGLRQDVGREVAVTLVEAALLAGLERRRRVGVGPAPLHEQLFAVLALRLLLVHPLQPAVVPLVEPPGPLHRQPGPAARLQRQRRRADRTGQQGRVADVGEHPLLQQELPTAPCLLHPGLGQIDIHPAGEKVGEVPLTLAVAEQHKRRHGRRVPTAALSAPRWAVSRQAGPPRAGG